MSPSPGSDPLEHQASMSLQIQGEAKTARGAAARAENIRLLEAIKRIAEVRNLPKSVIYREAIRDYVAVWHMNDQQPEPTKPQARVFP